MCSGKFRQLIWVLLFGTCLFAPISQSNAETIGVRAGQYTDMDNFFLGGEFISRFGRNLYFVPNAEYVFVDRGTYLTFNFDLHYRFHTGSPLFFWAGGGLGFLYFNPPGHGDSNNDLGANLVFGAGIKTSGSFYPYFQGKLILGDNDEFVIGGGIRF
jgi:hypothetical protein